MNTPTTNYAEPESRTRLDTLASSVLLATMLASALCGAFVVDTEATLAAGPARYASADEVPR